MEIHKLLSNDADEAPEFGLPKSSTAVSSTFTTTTSTTTTSPSSSYSFSSRYGHPFANSPSTPQQHHLTTGLMSDEMWIKIFAFLPPQVLCSVGLVCSEWRRLACDSTYYYHSLVSPFRSIFRSLSILLGRAPSPQRKEIQPIPTRAP
jgi:hypothetical protein